LDLQWVLVVGIYNRWLRKAVKVVEETVRGDIPFIQLPMMQSVGRISHCDVNGGWGGLQKVMGKTEVVGIKSPRGHSGRVEDESMG